MAKKKKMKKPLWPALLIVLISIVGSIYFDVGSKNNRFMPEDVWNYVLDIFDVDESKEENTSLVDGATFQFLDVGQGDATLIRGEDGTTILIDTGRYDDREQRIIKYLNEEVGTGGVIDLLVFTHPDADHIGHGDLILHFFDVKEVWMNGYDSTTKVYEKLLDALAKSDARYKEPKRGTNVTVGPFQIEVLSPTSVSMNNSNDDSISLMLHFGSFSALFTGDVSQRVEKNLLESHLPLQATLFQLGHHGSRDSNSLAFLQEVSPEIVIYSSGKDNSYQHPHFEAINRVKEIGVTQMYGTDQNGTITVQVDKTGVVTVKVEKETMTKGTEQ